MLAGPAALSSAILLHNEAANLAQRVALYVCIVLVCAASYVILRLSARSAHWLSPIAMSITTRIMGLLLAAVAMQFMLNAFKQLNPAWLPGLS
jgi:multiple antibiotic resistance protein